MVLIRPTSVVGTGTLSQSLPPVINPNGSVSFTAEDQVRLLGVFSADYTNYVIQLETFYDYSSHGVNEYAYVRMLQGNDRYLESAIYTQRVYAMDPLFGASQGGPGNSIQFSYGSSIGGGGSTLYFYGPYLTEPTGFRTAYCNPGQSGTTHESGQGQVQWFSGLIDANESFDGIQILLGQNTGIVSVYGLVG